MTSIHEGGRLLPSEALAESPHFVLPLADFDTPNSRTDGLKKLHNAGAPIPWPLYVIPHEAFEAYKEDPDNFIQRLQEQLLPLAQEAAANSNNGTLALRRAYEVPGATNPDGPRFLGLGQDKLIDGVKELYDFATQNNYDVLGAQVACFFYPFIDPEYIPLEEFKEGDILPFGGHVISSVDNPNRFQVIATWGNNETLMMYDQEGKPLETYIVEVDPNNPDRVNIIGKEIVQKDKMHHTTKDGTNEVADVPLSLQLEQVIWDSDIVRIAQIAHTLTSQNGPQRAEFSSDGKKIIFNETIDLEKDPTEIYDDIPPFEGQVVTIGSIEDVERLKAMSPEEREQLIILAADRKRGSPTNSALARAFPDEPLVILYKGTSRTAHAMKIFSDMGHYAFPVGSEEFEEGDIVNVSFENGSVKVENRTLDGADGVTPLRSAFKRGTSEVGPKAERISFLRSKGYKVPEGIVLTTGFFDSVLDHFSVGELLDEMLSQGPLEDSTAIDRMVRENITEIPDDLWQKITPFLDRYNLSDMNNEVIVRSSANVEDTRGSSFAGIFESIQSLRGEEAIRRAVVECMYSAFSENVVHYVGIDKVERLKDIKLGLIIQEQVDAQVSGTLFGGDTRTRDNSIVVIESTEGLATGIVDGEAEVGTMVYSKENGTLLEAEGNPNLSDEQIAFLLDLAARLEEEFGYPQDVEWSIDKEGKFWILQSRDL